MKKINCSDAGFDCAGVFKANSEEELMSLAAKHAIDVHGVAVTEEMAAQLKTLIKDEAEIV